MKLTRQFTALLLGNSLLAVVIAVIGVMWAIHSSYQQRQHDYLNLIADQIETTIDSSDKSQHLFTTAPAWLKVVEQGADIIWLQVFYQNQLLVDNQSDLASFYSYQITRQLEGGTLQVSAGFHGVWRFVSINWQIWTLVLVAIVALIAWAFYCRGLIVAQLSELADYRHIAYRILHGELNIEKSKADRPRLVRKAMDYLIAELVDAKQERSRFDAFMRSHTFLDPITGLGNRLYFDNQLSAAVRTFSRGQSGYVLLLEFNAYEELQLQDDKETTYNTLNQIGRCLYTSYDDFSDSFLARRSGGDYAILLPSCQYEEVQRSINELLRQLVKIPLPDEIDPEHAYHVGVARISKKEEPYQILSEADMALRAAQVQEINTWFMYDRKDLPQSKVKGSVQWRTLLEESLRKKAYVLTSQPVISAEEEDIHHYEMLLRLRDAQGQLMPASVFLPMAKKSGMTYQVDQTALFQLLKLMRYDSREATQCSFTLSVDSLLSKDFSFWFEATLTQYEDIASRLIIEVAEYPLVQHLDRVKPILMNAKAKGCQLAVGQVGQNIVSTNYIRELEVDYLKLHAHLTRNIDSSSENQLFVRSLLGACENTTTRVFALSVETSAEWKTMKLLGVYGGQGALFSENWQHNPAFL